jgi:hypothetical protein
VVLRFKPLHNYFLKPVDFDDISIGNVLHFVQSVGLLNAKAKGCTKDQQWLRCNGCCCAQPNVFYSVLVMGNMTGINVIRNKSNYTR